jgi:hypothetical protein
MIKTPESQKLAEWPMWAEVMLTFLAVLLAVVLLTLPDLKVRGFLVQRVHLS